MSVIGYWIFGTLAVILLTAPVLASDWYVGPQGTPTGQGTKESPWDIESALLGKHSVQPGDTIYLLGGIYRRRPSEQFEVKLVGAEGVPIHIRPAPDQRATIDGGLLVQEPSAYMWIWDLEILVSEPSPKEPVGPGSHPEDFKRPWGGLNMRGGTNCKYINLVIHDNRQGVSFWVGAKDSELHGCIIYDNGWPATDRGHGHAIYTQNDDGIKTISDCIMTGGYGYTMHAYGSSRAYVSNYLAEGNICYNGGTFLIGGGRPSHGIRVFRNYLYNINHLRLGYSAPYNEDCEVRDNVIVNGDLWIKDFKKVVKEGNFILSKGDPRPTDPPLAILRSNRYDHNRANLAIFNWDKRTSVAVDASSFLKAGDEYRLMDPREFFGEPILEDTYTGKQISVPVEGEFAAFVFIKEPAQ
jgi:hypothetical protein